MKKSLLALAVFGAFAGTASAQSNVTVYGVVDIGIAREDNGVNTVTRLDSGNVGGSRVGFKGTEDLGGGLAANFQLENGFASDTGGLGQGGRIFGRQAWVGLSGGFGAVKFGRQYMPIFIALDTVDPFDAGMSGGWGNTGAGITSLFMSNMPDVRSDNTINYSLSAGPVSGEIAYSFGEVAGSTSAKRQWGLQGTYANGPITAVVTYHNVNNATGSDAAKETAIGGVYNFGVAKLHAAYGWDKGYGALDQRDGMIGVTVPVSSAGNVLFDYLWKQDKAASNSDAHQFALGYTHSLSKRTLLYGTYARNSNDANVSYNAAAPGKTDSLFNLGIFHKF